jgi:hypothetical protein
MAPAKADQAPMRIVVALLLTIHGLAHLVGFRAAFWATAPQPGRLLGGLLGLGLLGHRVLGVVWLLVALGFLAVSALFVARSPAWSSVAVWVTLASALMCALFWPDAKLGLLIDVGVLLALSWLSRSGEGHLLAAYQAELMRAALPAAPTSMEMVDEASLSGLPAPVQRYMRFMGVVGRPRDWSLRARFNARFRRSEGPWAPCRVLQYDTRLQPSRIFYMQLSLRGVPVTVRDLYLRGRGQMQARAFDALKVAEGHGYELDVGELVTYLNDAVLMAPSLLLGPEVTWREVDVSSFDVCLRDGQTSVTARVKLDERGAPLEFFTTDRFFDLPDGKRTRLAWRTPVSGWQETQGRKLPTHAQAVWQLPSGPFAYADFSFDPEQIAFNVPPG